MKYYSHPTAIIETENIGDGSKVWAFSHICEEASIGKDCMIGEGVHIGRGVSIGNNCKIQNHALIYEGVTIEDDVFIGPNVVTTNDMYPRAFGKWSHRFAKTVIKKGAGIGANSTIVCGVILGEYCMVAAGSVVTSNLMKHSLAKGNPARHVRFMKDIDGSPFAGAYRDYDVDYRPDQKDDLGKITGDLL